MEHEKSAIGCVRLTLFWNRNAFNDKRLHKRFLELLEYKAIFHLIIVYQRTFAEVSFPNLIKKRTLAAIPLILIPEYGKSNAALIATDSTA